jgi:hypothetical protein
MIYNLVTFEIIPGKMAEYGDIVAKESVPLYPKLGMKQVAAWHAYTGNVNNTYALFAFNDLADFQKSREAQQKNKEYQRVQAKLNLIRVSSTYTILEPNSWSPMK